MFSHFLSHLPAAASSFPLPFDPRTLPPTARSPDLASFAASPPRPPFPPALFLARKHGTTSICAARAAIPYPSPTLLWSAARPRQTTAPWSAWVWVPRKTRRSSGRPCTTRCRIAGRGHAGEVFQSYIAVNRSSPRPRPSALSRTVQRPADSKPDVLRRRFLLRHPTHQACHWLSALRHHARAAHAYINPYTCAFLGRSGAVSIDNDFHPSIRPTGRVLKSPSDSAGDARGRQYSKRGRRGTDPLHLPVLSPLLPPCQRKPHLQGRAASASWPSISSTGSTMTSAVDGALTSTRTSPRGNGSFLRIIAARRQCPGRRGRRKTPASRSLLCFPSQTFDAPQSGWRKRRESRFSLYVYVLLMVLHWPPMHLTGILSLTASRSQQSCALTNGRRMDTTQGESIFPSTCPRGGLTKDTALGALYQEQGSVGMGTSMKGKDRAENVPVGTIGRPVVSDSDDDDSHSPHAGPRCSRLERPGRRSTLSPSLASPLLLLCVRSSVAP
ncbi:hypothetical protein V8E36_006198 [Tilletia maclaganii]